MLKAYQRMNLETTIKFLFIGFLLNFNVTLAQKQFYFDSSPLLLRESLDLIQKEQYGAARQKLKELKNSIQDKSSVDYSDASYYEALCAVQLQDKDATDKVLAFSSVHRSSSWMPHVHFLNGRVQFEQKRYSEALAAFLQVNPSDLPSFEQTELDYKIGYSQVKLNQSEEALSRFEKIKDQKSPYQQAATYYYAHIQYLNGNDDDALEHFSRIRNVFQFKKLIPVYELQIYYRKGNYDQVINMGEEVLPIVESKRKAEVIRMIADAHYSLGDYNSALDFYGQYEILNKRVLSREDQYQIGISRFKSGIFKEAIPNFQQVIAESDSLSQSASYFLAQCYLQTDQKTFARNAFLAVHKAPFDPVLSEDALFNYAQLSLEAGPDPYNEAIQLLEKYLESQHSSQRMQQAQQLIIQLYLKTQDYDAALASLENNNNRNPKMQAVYEQLTYSLAIDLFNQGDFVKAAAYFLRITTTKTNSTYAAPALFWLAESYYQQKNYVDAQKFYKQFISHRDAQKSEFYPLSSYNLGYSSFQLKQYQTALASFMQFTGKPYSKEPKLTYDAWLRIGDCYFISKSYDKAIESYNKVITSRATDSDYAIFQKGLSLGALGRYNEKIATLDQLVKQHTKSSYYDNALFEMASTSLITNDNRSAISYYDQLVRERPRSTYAREALLKTGLIYFNNRQNDQAIVALKKVAESYPGTPDAREAMNTLKVIYMDMNILEDFFAYTNKMGFGQISITEQDSLAFTICENFYTEGRTIEANQALSNYLKNYPNGAFLLTVHYYKSKLDIQEKKLDEALKSLQYIIGIDRNPYYEEALLSAARIYYERQSYDEAYKLYSQLYLLSDEPLEKREALEGKMKSSFFTKQFEEALQSSKQLLSNDQAGKEQIIQAHYIAGKSLFELNQHNESKDQLLKVQLASPGVLGAEASYLLAKISYGNENLTEAETQIFKLAEKYPDHDYWVAKGFLLLADVYVRNNNIFQARETLKSIVENYKGEDLRQEAARKLSMLD
jgi:TolA-binding protein